MFGSDPLSRIIPRLAVWAAILLAAACSPGQPAPAATPSATGASPTAAAVAPQRGGTLRIGLQGNPTTMDPHKSASTFDRNILYMLYDRLVDIDQNLHYIPQAADKWQVSDDGKQVTFFLHPGIKFSDGTPLDAAAVKFSLDRVRDPATKSNYAPEFTAVTSVDVVDPTTVRLNLKEPSPGLFSSLAERGGLIVSTKAVQDASKDFGRNPVGSGPFRFVEWLQDDHVSLERNPNYWRTGLPYLDRLQFQIVPDANVKVTNLKAGSLDMIDTVPSKDVASIVSSADLTYAKTTGLSTWQMVMNHTRKPFDNHDVREAMAWAIDRAAIQKSIFFGTGELAFGMLPPSNWGYSPQSLTTYKPDLAKAKELLAKAGYGSGFSFTMLGINQPQRVQVVQAIQSQLEPLGIKVTNGAMEVAQYSSTLSQGNYDAVLLFWAGRVDPDGTLYAWFDPKGVWDKYGYNNSQVNTLLEQARTNYDLATRKQQYAQAQKLIDQDIPMVFVIHDEEAKALSKKAQNFTPIPDGVMRFTEVWLKP